MVQRVIFKSYTLRYLWMITGLSIKIMGVAVRGTREIRSVVWQWLLKLGDVYVQFNYIFLSTFHTHSKLSTKMLDGKKIIRCPDVLLILWLVTAAPTACWL